jgi:hypothetical protein
VQDRDSEDVWIKEAYDSWLMFEEKMGGEL